MSSEWVEFALDQLKASSKSAFAMGPFGSNIKAENFVTEGVPVIKGGNLNSTYLGEAFADFLTHEKAAELASSKARPFDLVITHRGTLGQVGLIPEHSKYPEYVVSQSQLKLSFDRSLVDPYFIYYFLRSPLGQQRLLANTSQVGVPAIAQALTTIRKIKIELPTLDSQSSISGVLRSLDNRITLLRETNATLEAIAQALFKSWFVAFDPVRAKMEGRSPEGMDETTAALFPDGLEESELGAVPRGWNYSKLADVCTYLSRGLSPKYVEQGGVLVLNQKCIRGFSVDYSKGRRHNPALRKIDGRELAVGDVLVNSTGVGTLGRVAQVLALTEQAIVDSHVTVVRAGARLGWPYLGQWMAKKQPDIEAMGEGSTGQTELSKARLGELVILVPSEQALVAFNSVVEPLKNRVSLNERSAQTLATLRDTLLPRLISGQLRLPEAQAQVGEFGQQPAAPLPA